MIKNVTIKNFKSINKVEVALGRVTVFIGENGAGKSNILEAIALSGAAAARKLDNEFLTSRGIRVTQPSIMRHAFKNAPLVGEISINISDELGEFKTITLLNDNQPYSKWQSKITHGNINYTNESIVDNDQKTIVDEVKTTGVDVDSMLKDAKNTFEHALELQNIIEKISSDKSQKFNDSKEKIESIINETRLAIEKFEKINLVLTNESEILNKLSTFLIYSPENSSLRTFEKEGQVEPLGVNGEGLLKLISIIATDSDQKVLNDIKSSMKVLGWFEDFNIIEDNNNPSRVITVKDKYIDNNRTSFDQLSTNEGFLFLLFYFALFTSKLTPTFFAIDNIDASLNPKLCEKLIKILIRMAKDYDKQVILTTHNPSILDGLNLDDDDQRLFVISRSRNGDTKLKEIQKPILENNRSVRLSEMFIKGMLGGLPRNF